MLLINEIGKQKRKKNQTVMVTNFSMAATCYHFSADIEC